jgi:hypothetical protein
MRMKQQLPAAALAQVAGTKLVRRASHVASVSAARASAVLLSSGSTSRQTGTGVLLLFDNEWFPPRTYCSCMLMNGRAIHRKGVADAVVCVQSKLF